MPLSTSSASPTGVCASPNPDHRITGKVTELGELIAATYQDIDGKKSEVVGNYVTEKTTFRQGLTTSVIKNGLAENSLFVKSFYIGSSVYVFLMESAIERNGYVTPTVGRFCKTDNGGPPFLSSQAWTTFRKARLHCTFNGENIKFNHLGKSHRKNSYCVHARMYKKNLFQIKIRPVL